MSDEKKIAFEEPVSHAPVPTATASANQAPSTAAAKKTGAPTKSIDVDEHLLSFAQLMERIETSFDDKKPAASKGLSEDMHKSRLLELGPNVLTPAVKVHPIIQYLKCVAQRFNVLLIVCAIFTWILLAIDPIGNFPNSYIGAILFGVALLNAFIEFYQHAKSAALLESFLNMIPANCNFIKDGILTVVPAANLVPGDIIYVRMGDKIPADFYVFSSGDFKVDNSSLTGEAEPQDRVNHNINKNPLEATNLAFNGEAYGVVIRTGDQTVLGQIANLTQGEAKRDSPLSEEIEQFVKLISAIAIFTSVLFFIVALLRTNGSASVRVAYALNFAIGVLVAWVPQGLPATVSMLLTIAAKRMAAKQVLVKDLQGVETLGAITLLATDKTGTLTRNQMTVTNMWTSMKLLTADNNPGAQIAPEEQVLTMDISGVKEILYISAMCSRARFDNLEPPIAERSITGDATESGLFRFAAYKFGTDIDKFSDLYPKVFEVPFNSETKWHMTIVKKDHSDGVYSQFIKGAPERLLKICSQILIDGVLVPMTEDHQASFTKSYEYMAGKGHRVLAFAQNLLSGKDFPEGFVFDKEKKNFPDTELCFVGLISLEDPPKHGVREAIGHCREAGVKVMMVTGDHPLTAEAIGRKINLMISDTKERLAARTNRPLESIQEDEYFAIVIHGEKIDGLTDADWENIFRKDEIIFARTSPKHKLQIVKRAQSIGHITGDGVNDSPALKKADLGIAMNQSGSDVSKEAASMILLDDNFASTVHGISEGRLIFVNLKKSIQYVVTHIIPEVVPFVLSVIVPVPAVLGTLQILVIDLGFELFAALSYAWEPQETEKGLMKVPPRKPVTEESKERLKIRNAKKAAAELQIEGDPESGDGNQPSYLRKMKHSLSKPFTRAYWDSWLEKPEGEVLVDAGVLYWAYIEGGSIETAGCLIAAFVVLYSARGADGVMFGFTPSDAVACSQNSGFVPGGPNCVLANGIVKTADQQVEALAQAQSIYYFSVMIIQMFNLFVCKCRIGIPFGSYVLQNSKTWVSVLTGAGFAAIIVYAPPFNTAFGTSYRLSPIYWLIPMATGIVLLIYASIRRILLRKYRPQNFNPDIAGLQMYPTRWSTGK